MTKNITKGIVDEVIANYLTDVNNNTTLTPSQLTGLATAIAASLGDTVDPNGPYYPPTPR